MQITFDDIETAKPQLRLKHSFGLMQGEAEAYDASGNFLGRCNPPHGKPPVGTAILVLSIEDYMAAQKAIGTVMVTESGL